MRLFFPMLAVGLAVFAATGLAQKPSAEGSYRVLKTAKVGGEGGFDYVYADGDGRRLYIARSGPAPRVSVFNLDTLAPAGEIPMTNARGAAADAYSHHGFASSSPVAMWDTKTLALVKTIPVDGRPDGILADAFNHRIYIFSHSAPNATVLDAKDGAVLRTIDLGGAPEQAATDGKGHIYVDIEDKDTVAVVDAKTMKVTAQYSLNGRGGGNAGLALDAKNHVLFVACRDPQVMVMLDANDGKYLGDVPIGRGCDGAVFNPKTMECFSSQGDGTLTVIKEKSPTSFVVEQTVQTMSGAKTLTLDNKTGKILLIAAEFGPAPPPPADAATAPPAQRRGGRGPMAPGSFSILMVGR
jgi:DNA-binding beta-propeller fold protein YncE